MNGRFLKSSVKLYRIRVTDRSSRPGKSTINMREGIYLCSMSSEAWNRVVSCLRGHEVPEVVHRYLDYFQEAGSFLTLLTLRISC